jgi:2-polyprenyl-3-methyl-5-hydroxy-6-metoxy-1,4-benzoquinol methylase
VRQEQITFSFGKNWEEFVAKHFSAERVEISRRHMLDFLDLPDLKGKYLLDAGCGSGLSSLAALEAGAARVVGFDVDPYSVAASRKLHELRGAPAHWSILEGSLLDREFLARLEPADIVYSWGVLHHTGQMWQAIRNAAALLRPRAWFYIALYLTTPRSPYWIRIKQRYNRAGALGKRRMEAYYLLRHVLAPALVRGQNPFREILSYRRRRGMDFMTDVRDWLGGYPYEDASIPEVLRFCRRELKLNLVNIATDPTLVEYLFETTG